MSIHVFHAGRLPFCGDRAAKMLRRLAGAFAVFGKVPNDRRELNQLVSALTAAPQRSLLICPIAPDVMLADVSPAAVDASMSSIELAQELREKTGSQEIPILMPLLGLALSDPSQEVKALREKSIENAMVVLVPNLAGASDVISKPDYRIAVEAAESVLAYFMDGGQKGRPACSMAELLGMATSERRTKQ